MCPQTDMLRSREYSSTVEVESQFGVSRALGTLLCALLKCGRTLMTEELSCWKGRLRRLPFEPQCVQSRGGDKGEALWLAGYLSLHCCSAGRFVGDSVLIHQFEIHMAPQPTSMNTHFPSCP